jgi:hypothetical protein
MQKACVQFLCLGIVIRTPCREKQYHAFPGQVLSPRPLQKGGKTPPPDRNASDTPTQGLHTRGGNNQGNRGCVRNGTRCILLAHSCPVPNGRPTTLFGKILLSWPYEERSTPETEVSSMSFEGLPISMVAGFVSVIGGSGEGCMLFGGKNLYYFPEHS